MTAPTFVDTNIVVYCRQAREHVKQPRAAHWLDRLWRDQLGRTSIQVIGESYVTLTRKITPPLPQDAAWEYVETFFAWDPQPLNEETVSRGRQIEQRYRLSWWDSLIVSAAQLQNCPILLSEDLQHGARYGSVTVCNPFLDMATDVQIEYNAPIAPHPYRPRGRPRRQAVD